MKMIVAHANDFAIGAKNRLPWRCPADMKFFVSKSKELVDLVMGSTTANGIGHLEGRKIHTLSRSGSGTFRNVDEVIEQNKKTPLLICGGEQVYRATLPFVSQLFVTKLSIDIPNADSFFPKEYQTTLRHTDTIEEGISNNIHYKIELWER